VDVMLLARMSARLGLLIVVMYAWMHAAGVESYENPVIYSSDVEWDNPPDPAVIRCEVCQAVMRQLTLAIPKLVTPSFKGGRAVALEEALEDVCSVESFRSYDFSPPVMIKYCNSFISDYGDVIQDYVDDDATTIDELKWRRKFCSKKKICPNGLWEVTKKADELATKAMDDL